MIFKAKAKSQCAWPEYDQTDVYEQFRPAWFHFTSRSAEPRAANTTYTQRQEEVVMDILHPSKRKTSEPRRVYTNSTRLNKKPAPSYNEPFLALCRRLWIDEELFFAMNKLSILGLVIGLMFLGAVFFLSGFLMAVNLYGIGSPKVEAQLAAQGFNPHHMPTPGYTQGQSQTHAPAGFQPNRDINASPNPHYASVGGVAMIPEQRRPRNMQPQSLPTRGMATAQPQQARVYHSQPIVYPSYPQMPPQGAMAYSPAPPTSSPYPVGYYAQPPAGALPVSTPSAPPGPY